MDPFLKSLLVFFIIVLIAVVILLLCSKEQLSRMQDFMDDMDNR